jgi:predicted MPP superfamily phosphohydrolase
MPSIFKMIVLTLFSTLYFYIAHSLVRLTDWIWYEKYFILGMTAAMAGFVLFMPLYLWSRRNQRLAGWEIRFAHVGNSSLALLNFLVLLLFLRDIIGFAMTELQSFQIIQSETNYTAALYSRESSLLLLGLSWLIFIMGRLTVKIGPKVKRVALQKGIFQRPLRILQISDLHIGHSMSRDDIARVMNKASTLDVDLIVLTGDILDGDVEHHKREVLMLKQLTAPYGVYFVTGNHEYYWSVDFALETMARLGIKTLLNENWQFDHDGKRVYLAGVPDPAAKMFGLPGPQWEKVTPKNVDYSILLCHQPMTAIQGKNFHLALSGHTHGGQFWPWSWIIRLFQPYHKGLFRIGSMDLYVNQGTGVWGPSVRLGTRCELTVLEIT